MDLLFKRYASPFLLLERYISESRLAEFIDGFMEIQNEEMIWDVWLHKIFEKNFDEYKESILAATKRPVITTKKQLETTLIDSQNILNSFVPE